MSYQATCTFDLKNATQQDYANAYSDLDKIGLKRVVVGSNGQVVMPTTMTLGSFTGTGLIQVRDYVLDKVQKAFTARGFSSEIFVTTAESGTWVAGTTS